MQPAFENKFTNMDSRIRRYAFLHEDNPEGSDIIRRVTGKTLPGNYGLVTLNEDGSLSISKKAYIDDIVAFLFFASQNHPKIGGISHRLYDYVECMDRRAMEKDCFFNNEEAMSLEWEYDESYPLINDYSTEELEAELKRRRDLLEFKPTIGLTL